MHGLSPQRVAGVAYDYISFHWIRWFSTIPSVRYAAGRLVCWKGQHRDPAQHRREPCSQACCVGCRLCRCQLDIRIALGAQRREVLQAALGRAIKLLALGSVAGLFLGILASRVLAFIVYQATPRDPLVLAGVVLAMLLLGLLATWIPAQRVLSIDPVTLLREE